MLAQPPSLESRNTWLRSWRADDAGRLGSLYDDEARRWGMVPRDCGEGALRDRITDLARAELALGHRIRLAICDPGPDEVVGAIDLLVDPRAPSSAEVAFLLGPEARGRGLAARAVRLLSGWALGDGGFEHLHLLAQPANVAAHRVARRAGFRRATSGAAAHPTATQRVLFFRSARA